MKMTLKIGFLLLILFVVVGCATLGMRGSSWGKFVSDRAVRAEFESGKLDAETNYYYSGPLSAPIALMGLNKKYALDNNLWKPVSTAKMCMDLVQACLNEDMKDKVRDVQGFSMYAPSGEKIGVWFSDVYAKMRVRMGAGNKVIVYTPDQNVPEYGGGGSE